MPTINHALLQPVVALVGWTLVMLFWLLATRLPAMRKSGVKMGELVGTKPGDADRVLPPSAQWKAHNYMHLLEQPVLFYVVVIVLALLKVDDFETRVLAWGYVTFRIVHSIWQATINRVGPRFYLFAISTAILVALTIRAGVEVFGHRF
ncbi:MAPEG family protein [Sphingomonas sp.]|uniref:MAPEG family protein n=1 Tax=Sphingomonas sp. TaxID=28214 RepID=UPI002D8015AB|nr:MAPEG family protein [Sphingomonas sp.]HEU0043582.1 MAPEG family protein [Sphingomonas sp.]